VAMIFVRLQLLNRGWSSTFC